MLDVNSADDPAVKILIGALVGDAGGAGPKSAARLAIEVGEFAQLVEKLWPKGEPMPTGLDNVGVIDLAIALEGVGRSEDAVEVLKAHKPQATDVQGVLAGRLKRRWLVTRNEADYQSAVALYQQAYAISTAQATFNPDQAYYHGINLAFMELAHESNYGKAIQKARQLADEVLVYSEMALDRRPSPWIPATRADALVILGKWEDGLKEYRKAAKLVQVPWQAMSIEEQAIRLARLVGRPDEDTKRIADIYEGDDAQSDGTLSSGSAIAKSSNIL